MGDLKKVWEETEAWKNQSQYLVWVRGQLRKAWSDYPVRKNFKSETLKPITDEQKQSGKFHPSTKNVGECVFCNEVMAGSKLEVDHKLPSSGCKTKEEAEAFLWHCVNPCKADMQLSCKPCHKIKTYADRMGIPFDEAVISKKAIAFSKLPVEDQKKYLIDEGCYDYDITNAKKRKTEYKAIIRRNK